MGLDQLIAFLIAARDRLPVKGDTRVSVNDGYSLSGFAATIETDPADGAEYVQLDITADTTQPDS